MDERTRARVSTEEEYAKMFESLQWDTPSAYPYNAQSRRAQKRVKAGKMRETVLRPGRYIMKNKKPQPRRKEAKNVREQTKSTEPQSLVQFFAQSPFAKANLDIERTPDYGRKIKI